MRSETKKKLYTAFYGSIENLVRPKCLNYGVGPRIRPCESQLLCEKGKKKQKKTESNLSVFTWWNRDLCVDCLVQREGINQITCYPQSVNGGDVVVSLRSFWPLLTPIPHFVMYVDWRSPLHPVVHSNAINNAFFGILKGFSRFLGSYIFSTALVARCCMFVAQ